MPPSHSLDRDQLLAFMQEELRQRRTKQLAKLHALTEQAIVQRKNPYLFRFKRYRQARELAAALIDAALSSGEETRFGLFLEAVAIRICETVYGGRKSSAEGIDLEFARGGRWHIVSIKSGPNWGNSSQIKRMEGNFKRTRTRLRQNPDRSAQEIVAVNGCCYGRTTRQYDRGDYLKLCGQEFWELISGEPDMYRTVFELVGSAADATNGSYEQERKTAIARIAEQIGERYANAQGELDWLRILETNSSMSQQR